MSDLPLNNVQESLDWMTNTTLKQYVDMSQPPAASPWVSTKLRYPCNSDGTILAIVTNWPDCPLLLKFQMKETGGSGYWVSSAGSRFETNRIRMFAVIYNPQRPKHDW